MQAFEGEKTFELRLRRHTSYLKRKPWYDAHAPILIMTWKHFKLSAIHQGEKPCVAYVTPGPERESLSFPWPP